MTAPDDTKPEPWADPIVAEVHATRAKIWKEAGEASAGLHAYHMRSQEEARRAGAVFQSPTPEQVARVREALRRHDEMKKSDPDNAPAA